VDPSIVQVGWHYFLLHSPSLFKHFWVETSTLILLDESAEDEVQPVPVVSKSGAQKKSWENLGQERKRSETQKIVDELQKTAQARNVEPIRLIGTVLHRYEVWDKFFHLFCPLAKA
jgi:hypothetical protein